MVKTLKSKKRKEGFTLIELIIVIAIIAILAAISIPKFGDIRNSAATKTDIANAKTIATAAATLYSNGDIQDYDTGDLVSKSSTGIGKKIADYLQEVPNTKYINKGKEFYVVINTGEVTVYAGEVSEGNKLFPVGTLADE